MTARDRLRLIGVHPELVQKITLILDQMDVLGHPMFVAQGVRSTAQQQALYSQGRTKPGPKVTNADGVRNRSNHQPHPDGLGHAVDCAFVGEEPFGEEQPWGVYGKAVEAAGLTWGGSWKTLQDRPHAEL